MEIEKEENEDMIGRIKKMGFISSIREYRSGHKVANRLMRDEKREELKAALADENDKAELRKLKGKLRKAKSENSSLRRLKPAFSGTTLGSSVRYGREVAPEERKKKSNMERMLGL